MSNSVTLVDEGVVAVVGGDGLSPPAMLSLCRSVKKKQLTPPSNANFQFTKLGNVARFLKRTSF